MLRRPVEASIGAALDKTFRLTGNWRRLELPKKRLNRKAIQRI